jgi:hypothetical protein
MKGSANNIHQPFSNGRIFYQKVKLEIEKYENEVIVGVSITKILRKLMKITRFIYKKITRKF